MYDQDTLNDFILPSDKPNPQFVYSVSKDGTMFKSKIKSIQIKSWMKKLFNLKNSEIKGTWRKILQEKGFTVIKEKLKKNL